MTGSPRKDDAGRIARPTVESALEPVQLLAGIVDGSHDAILAKDRDARITLWNPAAERLYGYSAEEAVGRPVAIIVPPERAGEEVAILDRVLDGDRVEHYETERLRADGTRVVVSLSVAPLCDASGEIVGASTIARDITRRRVEQDELALLASLVDASADAVVSVARDRRVLSWNRAAALMFGVEASQAVGAPLDQAVRLDPSATRQRDEGLERAFATGAAVRYEAPRRLQGKALALDVTMSPVRDLRGEVSAVCIVARDVTEQQLLERRVQQSQRIESIGRLAGGIAHDFNNLLTVITGYAELAAMRDGPVKEELGEIQRAADRAAKLTGGLLDFSRQRALDPVALNLTDTVKGLMPMLERLIGEDIRMQLLTDGAIASVMADPGQIEQVVVNLALNARDAMPNGGTLTIETRTVELTAGHSDEEEGLPANRYACLMVSDTGSGIDPDVLEHLFEPFYTTKEIGEGTGLGLATVHGIVGQAGGAVRVYSEPGQGATFRVYLPAVDALTGDDAAAPTIAERHGAGETLLVCEDDDTVRALLERILRAARYTVMAAATPDQALRLVHSGARPDALVSDTIMPGLTGPELAERLSELIPALPTLFISGYTADVIRDRGQLPSGSAYLEKPFTPPALLDAVRSVLDRAPR